MGIFRRLKFWRRKEQPPPQPAEGTAQPGGATPTTKPQPQPAEAAAHEMPQVVAEPLPHSKKRGRLFGIIPRRKKLPPLQQRYENAIDRLDTQRFLLSQVRALELDTKRAGNKMNKVIEYRMLLERSVGRWWLECERLRLLVLKAPPGRKPTYYNLTQHQLVVGFDKLTKGLLPPLVLASYTKPKKFSPSKELKRDLDLVNKTIKQFDTEGFDTKRYLKLANEVMPLFQQRYAPQSKK